MKNPIFLLGALALAGCAGAQLEEQKQEIADLQQNNILFQKEAKAKSDEAVAKIAEVEGKLAIANAQIDSLTKSNQQLAAAVGASQDDLGTKLNEAVAQKGELSRQLADLQKEKLTLERLKNIYRSAREKAAADTQKLQAERDALVARLSSSKDISAKADEGHAAVVAKVHDEMGAVVDAILKDVQAGKVSAAAEEGGFALAIDDTVLFDDGSAKIREDGGAFLEKTGGALKSLGRRDITVSVRGDNAALKKGLLGGFDDGWALSAARAAAIARRMQDQAGLPPTRLEARKGDRRIMIIVRSTTP